MSVDITLTSKAMRTFGLTPGQSDPISYTCSCSAGVEGGSVLLFYRYWANDPKLAETYISQTSDVDGLAAWHRTLVDKHHLGGKIRIAREGYNITIGGTIENISAYTASCCEHWSFSGLGLDVAKTWDAFFKPTPGCACAFGQICSIRVKAEITPMGVEGYLPSDWNMIESLSPDEFHKKCHEGSVALIDVRNHYESRIGYFVSPQSGVPALRPPIRRFSQWPQYVKQHMQQSQRSVPVEPTQIMTYCTGGIRCEKAVRWMQENTTQPEDAKIATLKGGITAYLTWMDEEIKAGRRNPEDSLFKGRNYVFDARGSIGPNIEGVPVAVCHTCKQASDRLSKCRSKYCHLVLVVCSGCEKGDPRCCQNCEDMDNEAKATVYGKGTPRKMCDCESGRERELWGGKRVKVTKGSKLRTGKREELEPGERT